MSRRLALVGPLLAACTAAQSARVLPPGKTQVTVGANRLTPLGEQADGALWFGEVMVRRGFGGRLDGGLVLHRTPGQLEAATLLAIEPKVQLTEVGARTTASVGLSAGVSWADEPGGDGLYFEAGGFHLTPALYLGHDLSPTAELVFSPRLYLVVPIEDSDGTEVDFGGSLGVRFTDPARTWAVHPELSLSAIDDELFLGLGLSVSAGN